LHGGGPVHAGVRNVGHFPGVSRFHHAAHFRRGFRGSGVYAYYGDYSCWRWLPSRWGYVRVWVC
jgi:hypothetical protein